jgi:uncharacterized membrane protein
MDYSTIAPWELHPILVNFPVAFLFSGAVMELVAWRRPRKLFTRVAAGLLVAGVVTGWLAALAGLLAYWTVPHAADAHLMMNWHLAMATIMLLWFTAIAVVRWRDRLQPAGFVGRTLVVGALGLLLVAGSLGGRLVYRYGVGVDPESCETAEPDTAANHDHSADRNRTAEPDRSIDHDRTAEPAAAAVHDRAGGDHAHQSDPHHAAE